MNKKKILTIIASVLIFCFIGVILIFINGMWGNPISAAIATKSIKSYVSKTYPDMDLEVTKAKYNFKFNTYMSKIQSKSSMDTNFTVDWSDGSIYDSYEYDVLRRYKTFDRLSREFDSKVEEIISKEFEHETSILIADFGKGDMDLSNLSLDMPLDIANPPFPAYLTVYVINSEISYEALSSCLLELYHIMQKHGIPIDLYSVVLEDTLQGEEKPDPEGESLYLFDYPADKIESEELIEEIKLHQKEYEENHLK